MISGHSWYNGSAGKSTHYTNLASVKRGKTSNSCLPTSTCALPSFDDIYFLIVVYFEPPT